MHYAELTVCKKAMACTERTTRLDEKEKQELPKMQFRPVKKTKRLSLSLLEDLTPCRPDRFSIFQRHKLLAKSTFYPLAILRKEENGLVVSS